MQLTTLRLSVAGRPATGRVGRRAHLPESTTVPVEITPREQGVYEFTCGMNMYKGKLIIR